jgi:hypothetical protein
MGAIKTFLLEGVAQERFTFSKGTLIALGRWGTVWMVVIPGGGKELA